MNIKSQLRRVFPLRHPDIVIAVTICLVLAVALVINGSYLGAVGWSGAGLLLAATPAIDGD